MKVLMVLENEFPTDERVEKEALSLIQSGHEVHLACATLKNRPQYELYKGIHLHRAQSTVFYYKKARVACLTTPFYFNFWTKYLRSILAKDSFDVIHIHDLPLSEVGIKLSKRFKTKLVIDLHENFPYMLKEETYTKTLTGKLLSPISKWIKYESRILKSVDNVICVCHEMKERMNQITSKPNYYVLDNTIDIKRWPDYKPKDEQNEHLKTIYVGGFTVKRGIEIAIKGIAEFNKLSNQKATLDLYGSGRKEYINSLLNLASQLDVSDYIHFKGYIKLPEEAQNLGNYDVGLIPHLKNMHTDNTSPNKIFQYYYYKLPVLCADCNYLKRIVHETNGGLIYENLSPKDFALKLQQLSEGSARTDLAEHAYKSILQKYNWDKSAESLTRLYNGF